MAFLDETGLAKLWSIIKDWGLKDSTKTLYGLSEDATPDELLQELRNIWDWYVWEKYTSIVTTEWAELEKVTVCTTYTNTQQSTIYYSDTIDSDGNLINPIALTLTYLQSSNANVLKGKYWNNVGSSTYARYYTPSNADDATRYSPDDSDDRYIYIYARAALPLFTGETENRIGLVSSKSADAYPPAVSDGYQYRLLNTPLQIATGSYTGTGSGSVSLSLGFVPKLFITSPIDAASVTTAFYGGISIVPSGLVISQYGGNTRYSAITVATNDEFKFKQGNNGELNCAGTTYYYVAIG